MEEFELLIILLASFYLEILFNFVLTFLFAVLPVWIRGDILVLLEHGLLQPRVPADSLDQGTQETM